ncbi:hypothetical protein [Stutzerimonas nitrititolerans]|uniref:hypothetical protein n=1 Tax=Stutzerimonas nitrititolerans TaxID=2482751 RepID=UPI0028A72566|nr:hypothetical protein [Stutzerimonas nitrititolerans]
MARKTTTQTEKLDQDEHAAEASLETVAVAQGTDIVEYQPHEAAIVDIEQRFANVVFDVSTAEGLTDAKNARRTIREVRYALQTTTKDVLVPYQDAVKQAQARVNQVKEFGATLGERVLAVEDPVDQVIKNEEKRQKAEKERIAQAERERVEKIQNRITHFRTVAASYAARSAADIAEVLERVKMWVILPEEYAEFEGEATIARDNAIEQLDTLHRSAAAREESEAKLREQQEAFEKQQQELEELRRKNQEEQDRRDQEARQRLADQQAELDRQRQELQRQQDDQRRQDQEREDQHRRDQEELARLRAQAAAPVATTAPVQAAVTAPVPSAHIHQAPDVAASPAVTQAAPEPAAVAEFVATEEDGPSAQEIVEVVAMSFDMSEDAARALLKATQF